MSIYPPNPDNLPCYHDSIGWYQPGGCDEFSSYLHNPWGYPSEMEKKAIERFSNIIPNMDDYTYYTIFKFFKDKEKNKKEGLAKQYNKLKEYIIENKLIGIVLWGTDINNIDREIIKYTNVKNIEINLTINSICQYLIKEYIKDEIDELCKKSIE